MDLQPVFPFPVIRQHLGHRLPEGFVVGHIPDVAQFMDHHIGYDFPGAEYQGPGEPDFPLPVTVPPSFLHDERNVSIKIKRKRILFILPPFE